MNKLTDVVRVTGDRSSDEARLVLDALAKQRKRHKNRLKRKAPRHGPSH